MRWHSITSMTASLLLTACVGEYQMNEGGNGPDPDPEPGTASAKELYDALNQLQFQECGACHAGNALDDTATGPDYLGPDLESSYDVIMSYRSYQDGSPIVGNSPENSKLYFYGAHAGPALSDELAGLMSEWIIVQAEEDGVEPEPEPEPDEPDEPEPTPTGPDTLVEALQMFSDCMTYEDFEATNFENVADQNTAEGQCYACHTGGTGGAFLAQNNIDFYVNQRKMPYVLKFVTGTVSDDGSFKDLIISGRYEMKRDDNGHPNYIMANDRLASIEEFYELTYARYQNAIATGVPCTPDNPQQ